MAAMQGANAGRGTTSYN